MALQFNRALRSKQMCHVQTFHYCPPAYVLQGIVPQADDRSKDYESAMGGMTLNSASSTGMEERGIKDMEREPDVKEEQGGTDKE